MKNEIIKPECLNFLESKLFCFNLEKKYFESVFESSLESKEHKFPLLSEMTNQFNIRNIYINKYGFSILTEEVIEEIKKIGNILEVGCGSGYIAYELRKNHVDIIATTLNKGSYLGHTDGEINQAFRAWPIKFTDVKILEASEAILKYPDRNLLVVWPDYNSSWTSDMLKVFKGEYIIYCGESEGGCTGDKEFHKILETDFLLEKEISIPNFFGIYDRYFIYKRI